MSTLTNARPEEESKEHPGESPSSPVTHKCDRIPQQTAQKHPELAQLSMTYLIMQSNPELHPRIQKRHVIPNRL